MRTIVWKVFYNTEKEERWLNEMAALGLSLMSYGWCRYDFEQTAPGAWHYRIELLEQNPAHPQSQAYLRFLEETGVEHVASYMRWVYLRKASADGPFDLFSDLDSRIRHGTRILRLWGTLAAVELVIGTVNIALALLLYEPAVRPEVNLALGALLVGFGLVFLGFSLSLNKRLRALRRERVLRE